MGSISIMFSGNLEEAGMSSRPESRGPTAAIAVADNPRADFEGRFEATGTLDELLETNEEMLELWKSVCQENGSGK